MNQDLLEKLRFTDDWIDLGLISSDLLKEFELEYDSGRDDNSEHYRWRAFSRFLNANRVLPLSTLTKLYELGEKDPDYTLGGAMIRELIDRPEIPMEMLRMALKSDRKFLVDAAKRAIERKLK